MRLSFGLVLVLVLVLSLAVPEVESRSLRPHRGALARRGSQGARGVRAKLAARKGRGGRRKAGRRNRRRGRNGRGGRRRGRQDEIPEADVVTDDGGSGDGAAGEVCEVLMFDRGDGTYSLKFVQNKC
jgi:hypothetical protein